MDCELHIFVLHFFHEGIENVMIVLTVIFVQHCTIASIYRDYTCDIIIGGSHLRWLLVLY